MAVGDTATFGGGTDYALDFAEEVIGQPIPDRCRVGNYTLVNSLTRVG